MLFDIQQHGKKPIDFNTTPYSNRRALLEQIAKYLPRNKFHLAPQVEGPEAIKKLQQRVASGADPLTNEGVVIHPPTGKPIKVKNTDEYDALITGTFPGQGRRAGTIGGLTYAHPDKPGVTVGKVGTGFNDELLKLIASDPTSYIGRTARLRSQEKLPSGALRAPSFLGLHEDISPVKTAELTPLRGALLEKQAAGANIRRILKLLANQKLLATHPIGGNAQVQSLAEFLGQHPFNTAVKALTKPSAMAALKRKLILQANAIEEYKFLHPELSRAAYGQPMPQSPLMSMARLHDLGGKRLFDALYSKSKPIVEKPDELFTWGIPYKPLLIPWQPLGKGNKGSSSELLKLIAPNFPQVSFSEHTPVATPGLDMLGAQKVLRQLVPNRKAPMQVIKSEVLKTLPVDVENYAYRGGGMDGKSPVFDVSKHILPPSNERAWISGYPDVAAGYLKDVKVEEGATPVFWQVNTKPIDEAVKRMPGSGVATPFFHPHLAKDTTHLPSWLGKYRNELETLGPNGFELGSGIRNWIRSAILNRRMSGIDNPFKAVAGKNQGWAARPFYERVIRPALLDSSKLINNVSVGLPGVKDTLGAIPKYFAQISKSGESLEENDPLLEKQAAGANISRLLKILASPSLRKSLIGDLEASKGVNEGGRYAFNAMLDFMHSQKPNKAVKALGQWSGDARHNVIKDLFNKVKITSDAFTRDPLNRFKALDMDKANEAYSAMSAMQMANAPHMFKSLLSNLRRPPSDTPAVSDNSILGLSREFGKKFSDMMRESSPHVPFSANTPVSAPGLDINKAQSILRRIAPNRIPAKFVTNDVLKSLPVDPTTFAYRGGSLPLANLNNLDLNVKQPQHDVLARIIPKGDSRAWISAYPDVAHGYTNYSVSPTVKMFWQLNTKPIDAVNKRFGRSNIATPYFHPHIAKDSTGYPAWLNYFRKPLSNTNSLASKLLTFTNMENPFVRNAGKVDWGSRPFYERVVKPDLLPESNKLINKTFIGMPHQLQKEESAGYSLLFPKYWAQMSKSGSTLEVEDPLLEKQAAGANISRLAKFLASPKLLKELESSALTSRWFKPYMFGPALHDVSLTDLSKFVKANPIANTRLLNQFANSSKIKAPGIAPNITTIFPQIAKWDDPKQVDSATAHLVNSVKEFIHGLRLTLNDTGYSNTHKLSVSFSKDTPVVNPGLDINSAHKLLRQIVPHRKLPVKFVPDAVIDNLPVDPAKYAYRGQPLNVMHGDSNFMHSFVNAGAKGSDQPYSDITRQIISPGHTRAWVSAYNDIAKAYSGEKAVGGEGFNVLAPAIWQLNTPAMREGVGTPFFHKHVAVDTSRYPAWLQYLKGPLSTNIIGKPIHALAKLFGQANPFVQAAGRSEWGDRPFYERVIRPATMDPEKLIRNTFIGLPNVSDRPGYWAQISKSGESLEENDPLLIKEALNPKTVLNVASQFANKVNAGKWIPSAAAERLGLTMPATRLLRFANKTQQWIPGALKRNFAAMQAGEHAAQLPRTMPSIRNRLFGMQDDVVKHITEKGFGIPAESVNVQIFPDARGAGAWIPDMKWERGQALIGDTWPVILHELGHAATLGGDLKGFVSKVVKQPSTAKDTFGYELLARLSAGRAARNLAGTALPAPSMGKLQNAWEPAMNTYRLDILQKWLKQFTESAGSPETWGKSLGDTVNNFPASVQRAFPNIYDQVKHAPIPEWLTKVSFEEDPLLVKEALNPKKVLNVASQFANKVNAGKWVPSAVSSRLGLTMPAERLMRFANKTQNWIPGASNRIINKLPTIANETVNALPDKMPFKSVMGNIAEKGFGLPANQIKFNQVPELMQSNWLPVAEGGTAPLGQVSTVSSWPVALHELGHAQTLQRHLPAFNANHGMGGFLGELQHDSITGNLRPRWWSEMAANRAAGAGSRQLINTGLNAPPTNILTQYWHPALDTYRLRIMREWLSKYRFANRDSDPYMWGRGLNTAGKNFPAWVRRSFPSIAQEGFGLGAKPNWITKVSFEEDPLLVKEAVSAWRAPEILASLARRFGSSTPGYLSGPNVYAPIASLKHVIGNALQTGAKKLPEASEQMLIHNNATAKALSRLPGAYIVEGETNKVNPNMLRLFHGANNPLGTELPHIKQPTTQTVLSHFSPSSDVGKHYGSLYKSIVDIPKSIGYPMFEKNDARYALTDLFGSGDKGDVGDAYRRIVNMLGLDRLSLSDKLQQFGQALKASPSKIDPVRDLASTYETIVPSGVGERSYFTGTNKPVDITKIPVDILRKWWTGMTAGA